MTQKDKNVIAWVLGCVAIIAIIFAVANAGTTIPENYVLDDEVYASDLMELASEANAEISRLNVELAEATKPVEVVMNPDIPVNENVIDKVKDLVGYLIDKLYLGVATTSETYSDREISLFDGEVSFDGEDYDAEETLILNGVKLLANENDFEGNVYMTLPEDSVKYLMTFESDLNTSAITDEETLEFEFLGMNYEISSWDSTEITLTKGTEYKLLAGESIEIDGKVISLFAIDESGDKASLTIDGEDKVFSEGQTKTVNDLEVKVETVFDSEAMSYVKIIAGEDIDEVIETTDEYEKDSAWEYVITSNSIGIVLVEDHNEIDLDGDEEFQAIGVGESFSLPNAYLGIIFNGMAEEDTEEYSMQLDTKSSVDFVRIDGEFQSGLEDYDRVYVNVSGIYDRDLELIHATEIELSNTDSKLDISSGELVIEDFEVNFALDTTNIGSNDEDYLTDFGVLVMNTEDAIEDNEFEMLVPEEKLEGSISLI